MAWSDIADASIDDKSAFKTSVATAYRDNHKAGYDDMRECVLKTVDEAIQNDNALSNDATLSMTIPQGSDWMVFLQLRLTTTTNAQFKCQTTIGGGATALSFGYLLSTEGLYEGVGATGTGAAAMAFANTVDNVTVGTVMVVAYVQGDPAGDQTLNIQWAQNVSHADWTTVHAGSHLKAWRTSDLTALTVPTSYTSIPNTSIQLGSEWLEADSLMENFRSNNIYLSHRTREFLDKSAGAETVAAVGFQDDDDLQFTVEANETYQVQLVLEVTTTAARDFKFLLLPPSVPAAGEYLAISCRYNGTIGGTNRMHQQHYSLTSGDGNTGLSLAYTLAAGNMYVFIDGLVTVGTTGGLLKLQWSPVGAGNVTVGANSFGMVWRVSPIDTI